ncbi:T9SS type A sorting domain-containing protein [Adhaeribacter swui]|uniref:T9SS type A sorting domain-containing protein n=1 Tax=Adhaeribacter swui TaxID=2086471 RepID=A0A7G7GAM1_9BACT|nr:T9SS type A sorting domain-containing protein [Adhaeribacter swui]QNF34205.1 T9SS type A sorting domain-containing protein [Adhaeribacter swui]
MEKKFIPVFPSFLFLMAKWYCLLLLGFFVSWQTQAASDNSKNLKKILAGEEVTSLTLINSSTKATIRTITDGSTINLATLPTQNVNIRANTNPKLVGSVVFTLSGKQSRTQIETKSPYDLFGDNLNWTPAVGNYTLIATPYSEGGGGGTAGKPLSISFQIINDATSKDQVTSFTLINSATKATIQTITNGATINLTTLPTKNVNIRANTNPSLVGSVVLVLSGKQSRTQTETKAPYDLFGDNLNWTPAVGDYTLKATPYTAAGGAGIAGSPLTINFKITNEVVTNNAAPVANAGPDKQVTLPTNFVTLDGSGTDADGTISTYTWKQTAGPNTATFSSKNVANPTISNLIAGKYTFYLIVKDNLYTASKTDYVSVIVNPQSQSIVQVNFQDPATVPPAGWVADFGQPFGLKNGANQGTGLTYGWRKKSDNSLLDLSSGGTAGNGRNRGVPSDVLRATLMHMQADGIAGAFDGTKTEGYWEMQVEKGIYEVTVSAGDAGVYSFPESHSLNVEGASAITNFVPTGATGASTRFKSATVQVSVTDGFLTIDANSGVNTKINSVRVVPLANGPFTYWSANEQQLTIQKGTTTAKTFSLELSNSSEADDVQYTLSATYDGGVTPWLSFNPTHAGTEPNVTFNYTAAEDLPVGTYTATVQATANGFTAGTVKVIVAVAAPRPHVISSTPADGAVNVSVNTSSVAANNLFVPEVEDVKGGVDNSTITSSTVQLLKVVGNTTTQIQGVVQGTGGGDAISFSPTFALEPHTTYRFLVTDGVKSFSGAPFVPYTATFTTGDPIEPAEPIQVQFTPTSIPGTQNKKYSSLAIGPDDRLYALRLDGVIERFTINHSDGSLTLQSTITTLTQQFGNRSAIGLVFDPASTASNLIAYVSHCSSGLTKAPEFDGKISKLSGASLGTHRLLVENLPRSAKDHLVNSMAFGPDGALYISQGSNSSMGAYDGSWQRTESLLSGAVLRLDLVKLGNATLDARTTSDLSVINAAPSNNAKMSDGTYNPYSSASPLTIYASGVRNAYDLVWHSNGQLYVPANGSAAGGNTPASVAGTRRPDGTFYNGPAVAATSAVQVQNDWLFRINPAQGVGYYGHPNPMRGEYVANRGYIDNPKYPNTIEVDPNYRGAAFNFELNRSPNGAIEYKSNAFNGALKGKLLVCRFSGGGDIMVLKPGSTVKGSLESEYDIKDSYTGAGTTGLIGMSGFINPLDLVEDTKNGNLYVIEFNWNNNPNRTSQITLLRVSSTSEEEGYATAFPEKIVATEVVGVKKSVALRTAVSSKKEKDEVPDLPDLTQVTPHAVTISNTGRGNLRIKSLNITGDDAREFQMLAQPDAKPNKPIRIRKNSSVTFNVAFYPTSEGEKRAKLEAVSTKKKRGQIAEVELYGLGIVYEGTDTTVVDSTANNPQRKAATAQVATPENGKEPGMQVYPNPSPVGSKIYINLTGYNKKEAVTLSLYDINGQLYQAKTVHTDNQGSSLVELPVNKIMKPGIYIMKARAGSGTRETKVVLE